MLQTKKIAIIGGGNMGGAIAKGLIASGNIAASNITVTRHKVELLSAFADKGVNVTSDNNAAVANADIVIFAVKPWLIAEVIADVKSNIKPQTLVVSVASGVSLAQLSDMVGRTKSIVRVMPNTAAEVGESVTAVCLQNTTPDEQQLVEDIFRPMGLTIVTDEAHMAAITALASCGIAHALRFIRAMMESGIEMGLTSRQSADIAAQTVKGAAELILRNQSHPEAEVDKVCTPGGVTITGINALEHAGFSSAVIKGILASYNKILGK